VAPVICAGEQGKGLEDATEIGEVKVKLASHALRCRRGMGELQSESVISVSEKAGRRKRLEDGKGRKTDRARSDTT
jgi:hypothetical protein